MRDDHGYTPSQSDDQTTVSILSPEGAVIEVLTLESKPDGLWATDYTVTDRDGHQVVAGFTDLDGESTFMAAMGAGVEGRQPIALAAEIWIKAVLRFQSDELESKGPQQSGTHG